MKNIFNKSLFTSISLIASTSLLAAPVVDGFKSTGEYSNSFKAGWYNGHNESGSQYQKAGNHTTNVYWENTASNFFLYIEAPIEAKNMIWGTGFNDAEALTYYQHWCSPNDGNAAALDGSNCDHHNKGFDTFKADKTDFKGMTGSEKVTFGSDDKKITGDLAGGASAGSFYGGIIEYKDSVDYVFGALGCDNINCDASDTPMAFEFKFGNTFDTTQINMLISNIKINELEFHLSPERGGATATTPEPSSITLLGLGLATFVFLRKKKFF